MRSTHLSTFLNVLCETLTANEYKEDALVWAGEGMPSKYLGLQLLIVPS